MSAVAEVPGGSIDGLQSISYLVLVAGLVLAVANAVRFLRGSPSAVLSTRRISVSDRTTFGPGHRNVYLPLLLISAGFVIGAWGTALWQLGVLGLVAAAVWLSLRLLGEATESDADISGNAVALVVSFAALVLFGLGLTARLMTARTKEVFDGGVDIAGDSPGDTFRAVLGAPALLLIVLAVLAWPRFHRVTGDLGREVNPVRGSTGGWALVVGAFVVAALFAVPGLGAGGIVVAQLQPQEFGKICYLIVLAAILIRYGDGFRVADGFRDPGDVGSHPGAGYPRKLLLGLRARRLLVPGPVHLRWWGVRTYRWIRAHPHLLWPLGLFVMVAGINALRGDLGPLATLSIVTAVAIVFVAGVQARRALTASGVAGAAGTRAAAGNLFRYTRPLLGLLLCLGLLFVIFYLRVGHGQARIEVWQDPWAYPWAVTCVEPPPGYVGPPGLDPDLETCLQSYPSYVASVRSQVSQAIALVADGGLWGRGLSDTTSGRLPAGSYDFVLAVIWSKLGAIVVLLLSALMLVLSYVLATLPSAVRRERGADGARLSFASVYAVAMATILVAQFVVQLAMTVGMLPHSGLTAPFLSRGFQSTLALGIGVILGVVLAYRGAGTGELDIAAAETAGAPQWRIATVGVVLAAILALVGGALVNPYQGLAENRPFCGVRDVVAVTGRVDSRQCSTDAVAFSVVETELVLDGASAFRSAGAQWTPLRSNGPTVADMGGLLSPGVLSGAVLQTRREPDEYGLTTRLLPPRRRGGTATVALTIDERIQRTIAAAAVADGPGDALPLPAGIVVLDATDGYVLASASAPVRTANAPSRPAPSWSEQDVLEDRMEAINSDDENQGGIGQWQRDAVPEDGTCEVGGPVERGCLRWQAFAGSPSGIPLAEAELRRFVANDPTVELPDDTENRAFGRQYGLGSTFKVVIAAAYLSQPQTYADDPLEAPTSITVDGKTVTNAGGGECQRAVRGRITLADALAVSCNTAFVWLAKQVGWERIRDTAEAFGFHVGADPLGSAGAWLTGAGVSVSSTVPAETTELGNVALGGGQVVGTPLQMATVLAAIANDGVAVRPSLIADPAQPATRTVLTPAAAGQLRLALSGTTEFGTALGLAAVDGRQIWAKTGTHELVGPTETNRQGDFSRQYAWLVGFLDTARGPVAFAVRVATRDERAGAQRVRWLVQQVIDAVVRERG